MKKRSEKAKTCERCDHPAHDGLCGIHFRKPYETKRSVCGCECYTASNVRIVQARIFTVYFDYILDTMTEATRPWSVKVIAGNTEEAIAKTHSAYPGKPIDSVYSEKPHSWDHMPRAERDTIII